MHQHGHAQQHADATKHEHEQFLLVAIRHGGFGRRDDQLLERHGRWYLANRNPVWWRRNALIVLGNRGDPGDPRTRSVLDRYLADPDPILREHAEWAARRITMVDA